MENKFKKYLYLIIEIKHYPSAITTLLKIITIDMHIGSKSTVDIY